MLQITVPGREYYDEGRGEFFVIEEKTLRLEHSLLSISKWEARWKRSFLSEGPKNNTELADYVRCMCVDREAAPQAVSGLSRKNLEAIQAYIQDPMTATTFSNHQNRPAPRYRIVTSEEIYYSMFSFGIPIECQKWHINRLLTLIRVFQEKESPRKKMSRAEASRRNAELNALRKARMGTRG